jgi:hypothetical protein
MKTIISAAVRAAATVGAALLGSMVVLLVGIDRYQAWYRAYHSTLLVAIACIALTTGAAAAIGFRAGAPSLQQTKPTGTLAGVTAGLAVWLFLVLTGKEYSGGLWLPLLSLAAVVAGVAFILRAWIEEPVPVSHNKPLVPTAKSMRVWPQTHHHSRSPG